MNIILIPTSRLITPAGTTCSMHLLHREFVTNREKFEEAKHGNTTRKLVKSLTTQDYQTWNAIFAQVARIGEDMKKRSKKARGTPQAAAEDDSDDELEVLLSNVQDY